MYLCIHAFMHARGHNLVQLYTDALVPLCPCACTTALLHTLVQLCPCAFVHAQLHTIMQLCFHAVVPLCLHYFVQ